MKKFICIVLSLFLFVVPCSALSHTTYNGLSQNNSNVQNLISMAMNYDDFIDSKFVVYQYEQYGYCIAWGDLYLSENGSIKSNGDITYIRYYRTDNYNTYEYFPSTDTSFNLTVYDMITTNIGGIGMQSQLFRDYYTQQNIIYFCVFGFASLFVIMLTRLIRKD